jgi:hypothetical protein
MPSKKQPKPVKHVTGKRWTIVDGKRIDLPPLVWKIRPVASTSSAKRRKSA